jgi:uncharacterized cysteine cluster protein YcgN (CxxCxxCC family)
LPTDYTKVDLPKLKSDMLKWYYVIPPITETEKTAEISQRLRTLREKELAPLEEVNDYLINKKASNTVI